MDRRIPILCFGVGISFYVIALLMMFLPKPDIQLDLSLMLLIYMYGPAVFFLVGLVTAVLVEGKSNLWVWMNAGGLFFQGWVVFGL